MAEFLLLKNYQEKIVNIKLLKLKMRHLHQTNFKD